MQKMLRKFFCITNLARPMFRNEDVIKNGSGLPKKSFIKIFPDKFQVCYRPRQGFSLNASTLTKVFKTRQLIISFDISILPLNPLMSGGNKRPNVLKQICSFLLHVGSSTYDLLLLPGNKALKTGRNNVSSFMFIRKNV